MKEWTISWRLCTQITNRPIESSSVQAVTCELLFCGRNANAECLHVCGRIYPLIRLHDVFGIETELKDPTCAMVILVHTNDKCAGILVDRILGRQRAVIKDLKGQLAGLQTIAGTAILANTRVGLVLNVQGIIEKYLG